MTDSENDLNKIETQYNALPDKEGDIDWDYVSQHYHSLILGPFQPQMTCVDAETNERRNRLIDDLIQVPNLKNLRILDIGSGPGNLIPFLAPYIDEIWCIDKSYVALAKAVEVGETHGVKVHPHCLDFTNEMLLNEEPFGVIVSVCSILPSSRDFVVSAFHNIRLMLKPDGELFAILPSFDTTEHLITLWHEHYSESYSPQEADSVVEQFKIEKQFNNERHCLYYADDGQNIQCYHTPQSIRNELHYAHLDSGLEMAPIYYPWNLTTQFDYGYFPDADHEIWDWFIRTRPSS